MSKNSGVEVLGLPQKKVQNIAKSSMVEIRLLSNNRCSSNSLKFSKKKTFFLETVNADNFRYLSVSLAIKKTSERKHTFIQSQSRKG